MRTTIDLPDELLRRAKATAALRGMKLKELVAQVLEQGLGPARREGLSAARPERSLPVMIPPAGRTIPALTNEELEAIFLQEDIECLGLR